MGIICLDRYLHYIKSYLQNSTLHIYITLYYRIPMRKIQILLMVKSVVRRYDNLFVGFVQPADIMGTSRNVLVKQEGNKAGYTATEVACGWAGAIFEVTRPFGQEQ